MHLLENLSNKNALFSLFNLLMDYTEIASSPWKWICPIDPFVEYCTKREYFQCEFQNIKAFKFSIHNLDIEILQFGSLCLNTFQLQL